MALAVALIFVFSASFFIVYLERFPRRLLLASLSRLSSTSEISKGLKSSIS
jgi:hypothetical protein